MYIIIFKRGYIAGEAAEYRVNLGQEGMLYLIQLLSRDNIKCVFCTHYTMVFAGSATSAIAIPSSDGSSSLSSTSQSTLVSGISPVSGASAGELY